jgi:hypothetical protein
MNYNLPTETMGKLQRYLAALSAAGVKPEPWKVGALLKGGFDETGAKEDQNRRLSIGESGLSEQIRMNNLNTDLAREKMASEELSGKYQLGGNLISTAMMYPLLRKKWGL